ncbi:glucokinase regulatory protein-like [Hydractinia symbiolongicarpus]|uniref:glucokinase regulatory protein-like n=1 Tax=Hydractinia symbiolongicarpus TaxID=13093 RepID=UPI00254BC7FA|nr:glucokinase regulatory protein-like [Hydractinia symbiolongicarpus]
MDKPFTEQSNHVSKNIDICSSEEILDIFKTVDLGMFAAEVSSYPGLLNELVLSKMYTLFNKMVELQNKRSAGKNCKVVVSGCGTSGRIGFLISTIYDELLSTQGMFDFCMAGGVEALFSSVEAPEDNPDYGMQDLVGVINGHEAIFIGISCGLSAPYVAGQLHHCLTSTNSVLPVIIGFNPVHLARDKSLQQDQTDTFKSILQRMLHENGIVLNPVIGSEVITGSSRLKGGTAAYIILNSVIFASLSRNVFNRTLRIETVIEMQRRCIETTYSNLKMSLPALITMCGDSIREGGSVYYLGLDYLGLVGLFDAAECVPTFGCNQNDFRALITTKDSFRFLKTPNPSVNLGITLEDFVLEFKDKMKITDTVIFLKSFQTRPSCPNGLLTLIKSTRSNVALIQIGVNVIEDNPLNFSLTACIELNRDSVLNTLSECDYKSTRGEDTSNFCKTLETILSVLATKIVLNATSTGSFVLAGKVYENLMIDIKLSNSKLFERGLRMLQEICHTDKNACEENILKAIYRVDAITRDIKSKTIDEHVEYARSIDRVIPIAVIMTSLGCVVKKAEEILNRSQNVRTCVNSVLKK